MKNRIFFFILIMFGSVSAFADNLPVKEWNLDNDKPLVLYITGDGGMNDFSTALCTELNKNSFSVTAINAKSYFWDKKTPEQSSADIAAYLFKKLGARKNKQVVLAGYSFGADVLPFIVNRLPDTLRKSIVSILLLSPSSSTDFEIHVLDLFGINKKRSMDVPAEINKLITFKTVLLFGDSEDDFPVNKITSKAVSKETLAGGHHFDGNTAEVAKVMMKYFK